MKTQIPKIIHYCWLSGDPYPKLIHHCIESWKKHLPDYKLMLWDTHQIDIYQTAWLKESFETKKYAFAADYIRFYALYHHGGIYLDSDVEVKKSFNDLLSYRSFFGMETSGDPEAAIIGTIPGEDWTQKMVNYYENKKFIQPNGSYDMEPLPLKLANTLQDIYHIQLKYNNLKFIAPDFPVFPSSFFSPKNIHTKKIEYHPDTYAIHHFDGSWVTQTGVRRLKNLIHKLILLSVGPKIHRCIVKLRRND